MSQRTTTLTIAILCLLLALALAASAALAQSLSYNEWLALTSLPYREANARMSSVPEHEEYKIRFTGRTNPNEGWAMHPTDHEAALKVILGREPTWAEVWRSLFSMSNIDTAWRIEVLASDGAPKYWPPPGTPSADYDRRRDALHWRLSFPIVAAILDDRRRDPEPVKTAAKMAEWDAIASKRVGWVAPPTQPTPPPVPEPTPEPPATPSPTPVSCCPAGQSCSAPCAQPSPCPSCPPAIILPPECAPIAAVRESAEVIARNTFTAQRRRQRVADCVKAIERTFAPAQ